ncbi:MAG TPA: ATP-binding protein [Anaerolineales bacterium]|nr:ATP-binding protein [Anaerolineales bacterium]
MTALRKFFAPPVFGDEIKTRKAQLLSVILWGLILIPIPYLLYHLIAAPEHITRALIQTAFGETANVILLYLLRRGHIHLASILQVALFWLFFTASAFSSDGVRGAAYLLGYPLVIVIAGVLLEGRAAMIVTVFSLMSGGIMAYMETQGWLVSKISREPFSLWAMSLAIFPMSAALQNIASREIRNAFFRARASEEKYRLISRVTSDYTFSTRLDSQSHMHLDWVAGAFQEITGYAYEEYVSAGGWAAHLHPEDTGKDAQALAILKTNQQVIHDIRTYTKAREIQWVRVYAHPVWNDEQNKLVGIVGAVQDITQQHEAEERELHRRAMLEKVVQLGKRVTEVNNLRTTLEKIWRGVHEDLGFDRLAIFLYDIETNSVHGTLGTDDQGNIVEEWDYTRYLAQGKNTSFTRTLEKPDGIYVTHNFSSEYNIPEGHEMSAVKDFAAIAAWAGDKPVAIITVDNAPSGRPITDEQLEALRLFGGYAGLAIENARLNDRLQNELEEQKRQEEREARRRTMLEKVVQLGKVVTEVKDLPTTLERIWHGVHDDLGFDRLAIFLYNQEHNSFDGTLGTNNQGQIVEEWDQRYPRSEITIFTHLLEQPDGFYFTHDYAVEHEIAEDNEMYGVKDYAAVAAWSGGKPIAVICVDNLVTSRPIAIEELEALRLFGGYAGLAIENARLNSALQNELAQRQSLINELESKNAELERFTYTVSHDLKSPLVTITGFLGYLEKDALSGDQARVKSAVERITLAAQKMQSLLNDLLELSRIGRTMNLPEHVPFEEVVREAVERVHGRLDAKKAEIKVQTDLPIVYGDRVRLVEVMQNLLDNAAKYASPASIPCIEIGAKAGDEHRVTLFVHDNGIGIDPQFHERIFGLFNKLDTRAEGTGIGLTLVKRIIEVHGGYIWVESELGNGATFYFTLPKTP